MKVTLNRGEPMQFTINGKGAVELSISWIAVNPQGKRCEVCVVTCAGHSHSFAWSGPGRAWPILQQGTRATVAHDESGSALAFECLEIRRDCIVLDVEEVA